MRSRTQKLVFRFSGDLPCAIFDGNNLTIFICEEILDAITEISCDTGVGLNGGKILIVVAIIVDIAKNRFHIYLVS